MPPKSKAAVANQENEEKASSKKSSGSNATILKNKTVYANPEKIDRKWYLIDANGKNLGRMAVEIAKILRGKRNASFTPNADTGDFVIVVNARHITFTGKRKGQQTKYHRYTGFPGGLRVETLDQLLDRIPEKVLFNTIKGMLPKTTLGRAQLAKLKIYADAEHPHAAQKPITLQEIPLI